MNTSKINPVYSINSKQDGDIVNGSEWTALSEAANLA
jgi:hypothetical protein